jgi:nucleoid-associated protein YgaU
VGARFVTSAAAVLALCATRPHLAGSPATWSADDVARAACWVGAAAWTGWSSVTAVALSIARTQHGLGSARRALDWAPPFARHVLRAALAGSLAVAPPPPVTVHVGTDGRLTPGTRPAHPAPSQKTTTTTTTAPRRAPQPTPRHAAPRATHTTPSRYRVRPGDNLWTIARDELRRRAGRGPDDREIAPYWLRLIAANRATLRSGDPNLIYPGEILELPNP